MSAPEPDVPRALRWSDWLPLGAWIGTAAATVRSFAHFAAGERLVGEPDAAETAILRWDSASGWDTLGACWAVGALVVLALARARRERTPARAVVALVSVLVLVVLTAGPFDAPRLRAGLHGDLAWDDVTLHALLAVGVVGTLSGILARRSRQLAGRVLPVASLAVALLLPAVFAAGAGAAPSFVRRMALLDLLEQRDLWTIVERHPDLGPGVTALTPAVNQHADSADKPSLWMPPPCTVEIALPGDAAPGVLRAAAGVDKQVRGRMPAGIERVTIEFEVLRNGASVFRDTVTSERPRAGSWSSPEWVWRHAGGAAGIPVGPGDRLTFRTSLPAGDPGERVPASLLRAGFGGMVVEAQVETRRTRASASAPNLVLIVMDTLRADRMSCYGYPRQTTPVLDALATSGMLFERAYATSSWTWPSTASILTGLSADAHGVTRNESCTLNLALTTLPEVLQSRGYTTAAFSGNPLVAPERYFDQGFEHFDHAVPDFRMSDELVPSVLRWLDGHAGARFFLYLHLVDPHTPHRPHPADLARLGAVRPEGFPEGGLDAFSGERLRVLRETGSLPPLDPADEAWVHDVYDASVATGDRWVGLVLERLEQLGVRDETIVVFTADHGEELLDRDRIGHGHGLHAELVRAPLVIAGPGIPAGVRVPEVVSNRHVAPTLAHFAGGELAGMGDGVLLTAAGESSGAFFQTAKGNVGGRNYQELFGLRRGDLVLHWWKDGEGDAALSLFDAEQDPRERGDLAAGRDADVRALLTELQGRLDAQRAWAPKHVVGVGAGGLETLYNIGYADRDAEDEDE